MPIINSQLHLVTNIGIKKFKKNIELAIRKDGEIPYYILKKSEFQAIIMPLKEWGLDSWVPCLPLTLMRGSKTINSLFS